MQELFFKPDIGELQANREGIGATLVGLWPDCSIDLAGTRHGVSNRAKWIPGPQGGRARYCTGSPTYVAFGSTGFTSPQGALFARLYFPSGPGGSRCVLSQSNNASGFLALGWQSTTGWVGGGSSPSVSLGGSYTGTTKKWTTLALTWGESGVRFFQDGKLTTSSATKAKPANSPVKPLTLGAFNYNGGIILHQEVIGDFLAVFDSQLTDKEISSISARPLQLVRLRESFTPPLPPPGTFTAAAALFSSASTLAAVATYSPGTKTAAVALSGSPSALSAAGTITPPSYSAAVALESSPSSLSAAATFVAPAYTAAAELTSQPTTLSAAATFTPPTYTAAGSLESSPSALAAIGTFDSGTFTATAALVSQPSILAAAGSFESPAYTAIAALSSAGSTLAASATSAEPTYTAAATLASSPSSLAAIGNYDEGQAFATATLASSPSTLAANGSFEIVYYATAALVSQPSTLASFVLLVVPYTIRGRVSIERTGIATIEPPSGRIAIERTGFVIISRPSGRTAIVRTGNIDAE